MQKGAWSEVAAIASRDARKAEDTAHKLGIEKAQLVGGIFRFPRITRSNGRHLAPSALLHSRDHFASGNRRHTQHSPFHLLPFHDPASLSLPTSIMPPWPVHPPSRIHLLRDPSVTRDLPLCRG